MSQIVHKIITDARTFKCYSRRRIKKYKVAFRLEKLWQKFKFGDSVWPKCSHFWKINTCFAFREFVILEKKVCCAEWCLKPILSILFCSNTHKCSMFLSTFDTLYIFVLLRLLLVSIEKSVLLKKKVDWSACFIDTITLLLFYRLQHTRGSSKNSDTHQVRSPVAETCFELTAKR